MKHITNVQVLKAISSEASKKYKVDPKEVPLPTCRSCNRATGYVEFAPDGCKCPSCQGVNLFLSNAYASYLVLNKCIYVQITRCDVCSAFTAGRFGQDFPLTTKTGKEREEMVAAYNRGQGKRTVVKPKRSAISNFLPKEGKKR